jgi:hypothetical protein
MLSRLSRMAPAAIGACAVGYAISENYPKRAIEAASIPETLAVAKEAIGSVAASAAIRITQPTSMASRAVWALDRPKLEKDSSPAQTETNRVAVETSKVAAEAIRPSVEVVDSKGVAIEAPKVEIVSGAARGIISGATTPLVTAHLDAARHNSLMRSHDPEVKPLTEVLKKDPIAPFRNGALKLSLLNNLVKFGVLNLVFEDAKSVMKDHTSNPVVAEASAGVAAGIAEAMATAPVSYVAAQIKMGMSTGKPVTPMKILSNFLDPATKKALESGQKLTTQQFLEGVQWSKVPKTLFTNMPLSMARNSAFAATYFPLRTLLFNAAGHETTQLSTASKLGLGAVSGAIATAIAHPFANAADIGKSLKDRVSTKEVIQKILQKDGMAGFYRNLPLAMVRMAVVTGAVEVAVSGIEKIASRVGSGSSDSSSGVGGLSSDEYFGSTAFLSE